ncbi:hypothetical protein EIL18_19975 [Salmonella enterica subsp. enterica]|nr:hypothetical protein [Salmonella enterica subsp. enterica]
MMGRIIRLFLPCRQSNYGGKNHSHLRDQNLVVILVVLTSRKFRFSLLVSQLPAKAIPVRGARF